MLFSWSPYRVFGLFVFVLLMLQALLIKKSGFGFGFGLATPVGSGKVHLRLGFSLVHIKERGKVHFLARLVLHRWLEALIHRLAFEGNKNDVSQDFAIWEHKTNIAKPPLANGDGPVG